MVLENINIIIIVSVIFKFFFTQEVDCIQFNTSVFLLALFLSSFCLAGEESSCQTETKTESKVGACGQTTEPADESINSLNFEDQILVRQLVGDIEKNPHLNVQFKAIKKDFFKAILEARAKHRNTRKFISETFDLLNRCTLDSK